MYVVLSLCIARRLVLWLLHPRRSTPFAAASEGGVDGFERLGPTFVKVGQMIASSPGIFPTPLATACLRCLDDVAPFPGEQAVEMITKDLGRSPGRVFSRQALLERVWEHGFFGDERIVDVHVRRLRTKVERDPSAPRLVVTVRGLGYRLDPQ